MTELEELRLAYAECSRQKNELLTAHKVSAADNAAMREQVADQQRMSEGLMFAGAQVNALQANERRLIDKMWETQQQRDRLSAALQVIADDVCDNSYTRTARAALKEGGKLPPPIDIARAALENTT